MKKTLIAALLTPILLLAGTAHASDTSGMTEPTPETPLPTTEFRFLSSPDLFNGDIADVREGNTFHEPGDPNSWNSSYATSIQKVFAEFASFNPDAFLMAGDAVQGHWGLDNDNTGIFGPTDTYENKVKALHRAANLYYGAWRKNFINAGIPMSKVHNAVGDHEIGDNNWPAGEFKIKAFPEFTSAWIKHFTNVWGNGNRYSMHPVGTAFDETAYAVWLHSNVLLVTVDTFRRDTTGVRAVVDTGQLTWLRDTLARARANNPNATILVQGHVPVLTPVRTRGSSGMVMEGGATSGFWKALNDYGVAAYLCGEVHATTVTQEAPGRTIQIAHGGLLAWGATDFISGQRLSDGTLDLDFRRMTATVDKTTDLWQTAGRIAGKVFIDTPSIPVGRLVITPGNTITERVGTALPFDGNS